MLRTRHEAHPASELDWFSCPVCRRMEFVALPRTGLEEAIALPLMPPARHWPELVAVR
jgi:hypothetical protein